VRQGLVSHLWSLRLVPAFDLCSSQLSYSQANTDSELRVITDWPVDCRVEQSHAWVAMEIETKFLRLFKPASPGDRIDGWRVCWVGGWDKCRVLFVVMVEKPRHTGRSSRRPSRAR
jgi:hypothetical protein